MSESNLHKAPSSKTDAEVEEAPKQKYPLVEFPSFSWSEEKMKVKIYIDFENANTVENEMIQLVRMHYNN